MTRPLIIAIDGPSGAGKSTLGRMVARALNLLYIDTGSMYRAVARAVMESSISQNDDVAVGSLASRVDIDLQGDPDALRVTLGGRDVTEEIRTEEVTDLSSIISTIPAVRRAMVKRQREMGQRGAVLNGRDIGTVVFPDADVKFFLTAVPEERAQRRFAEEREQDPQANLAETLADMTKRDRRDTTRADSPLKTADDAIIVDSTGLSIDEVFQQMMAAIEKKSGGSPLPDHRQMTNEK
ncbi:MAG TPA: (d)CMP kinase [Blastocatellia bacterium]|nr:(d)CMP kinase [Blastocatellia bacterium]HAF24681.1 (d)CMP kinase [Blastocatellia bacterium]HCX31797.1 (d)CMP kinase [Blastocatellia bacterium]